MCLIDTTAETDHGRWSVAGSDQVTLTTGHRYAESTKYLPEWHGHHAADGHGHLCAAAVSVIAIE